MSWPITTSSKRTKSRRHKMCSEKKLSIFDQKRQMQLTLRSQMQLTETMARCFVCHSISVCKFDLLHGRKCTLTHICASKRQAHFLRNLSVWEIYLCWFISRTSQQSALTPVILYIINSLLYHTLNNQYWESSRDFKILSSGHIWSAGLYLDHAGIDKLEYCKSQNPRLRKTNSINS